VRRARRYLKCTMKMSLAAQPLGLNGPATLRPLADAVHRLFVQTPRSKKLTRDSTVAFGSLVAMLGFTSVALAQSEPSAVQPSSGSPTSNAVANIVITATRVADSNEQLVGDITVISRAQIQSSGLTTLTQILSQFGGVESAETGGLGKTTSFFVRGTKTAQTLVLIDGVKLQNAGSGAANLEFLNPELIERIELVRGPSSALYGSAAVGGVIQIFTRGYSATQQASAVLDRQVQLNGSIDVGSFNQRRLSAGVEFGNFSIQAAGIRSDGFDLTLPTSPNAQADKDSFRNESLSLRYQGSAQEWLRSISGGVSIGKAYYDDAWSTPDTAWLSWRQAQWSLAFGKPIFLGSSASASSTSASSSTSWTPQVQLGSSETAYSYGGFTYAPKAITRSIAWDNSFTFAHSSTQQAFKLPRLQVGIEHDVQTVRGDGVGYSTDRRTTQAIYMGAQALSTTQPWHIRLRYDTIKANSAPTLTRLNYSVGAGLLVHGLRVSASAGSAFRAPTFDDLFSPFGGNSSLKPERSNSVEFSLGNQRSASNSSQAVFNWNVVVFDQTIKDAIELDSNFQPQNTQRVHIRGLTFQPQWLGPRVGGGRLSVEGQLTLQEPKGLSTGLNAAGLNTAPAALASQAATETLLARRARQHGQVNLQYAFSSFKLNVGFNAQGKRIDSDGTTMGGYAVVNAGVSYELMRQFDVSLRVLNLTGREYETAAGYRSTPRSVYLGLQGRW
jgi:vitamin B12 transporter